MTEEDLLYFENNLIEKFDDFWSYSILKDEFYGDNKIYIVAKENNEIVGFAGLLIIIDEANIMNIVTRKDKRSNGIGSKLLAYLIYIAKEKNMNLYTRSDEHTKLLLTIRKI